MFNISKLISISFLTSTLLGCSLLPFTPSTSSSLCADDDGNFETCKPISKKQLAVESAPQSHVFTSQLHFNHLSEYTEQMAAELYRDVMGKQINEPIAVASFVNLDNSLRNTNSLGIQLAESFINELQQIGLPVSDHKLMGVLDINTNGDFAFSRNMDELYNDANIGYVLSGTMQQNNRGVMINARLVNFKTNVVVASSSKFLPNAMVKI